MAEEESAFSDLKFTLLPQINGGQLSKHTQSQASLAKYDSLLERNVTLRSKVEIIHKRSFEKFIKTMDNNRNTAGIRVSRRKLPTTREVPVSSRDGKVTEQSVRTERGLIARRSSKNDKFLFNVEVDTSSRFNNTLGEIATQPTDRRDKTLQSSVLLPDKSDKVRMATNLAKLKQAVDECQKREMPEAALLRPLISSFESLMDKESYYASVMKGLIAILRKSLFVCQESRSLDINIILQLNNQEVNSIMFTEAGEGKLTHYECSQKILKAFLTWASAANSNISELENTIKSNQF